MLLLASAFAPSAGLPLLRLFSSSAGLARWSPKSISKRLTTAQIFKRTGRLTGAIFIRLPLGLTLSLPTATQLAGPP